MLGVRNVSAYTHYEYSLRTSQRPLLFRKTIWYILFGEPVYNTKEYPKLVKSPLGPTGLSLYVQCKVVAHLDFASWFINSQLAGKWDVQTILPVVEYFFVLIVRNTNECYQSCPGTATVFGIGKVRVSLPVWNIYNVKCPMLLSCLNQTRIFTTHFTGRT
jgi:hypothetical protein